MDEGLAVFAGRGNPRLAAAIAGELGEHTGACLVDRFPDGEVAVRLLESVRGRDVVLVQPTSPPVNDHLVELLALTDACRRGAAARITAVMPYFGYGRADKRQGRREPIMGRIVADLLENAGIGHLVTIDPHTPQLEGFFRVPVDSLTAVPALCRRLQELLVPGTVIVSPDAGRVPLAQQYAECLELPVVTVQKRRVSGSETEVFQVAGDVSLRACLIVDDIIATGGTIAGTVRALLENGARPEILVAATHGLLLPGAREKLAHSAIRAIVVTDSAAIEQSDWAQLHVVSVAPLLAGALRRLGPPSRREPEPTPLPRSP